MSTPQKILYQTLDKKPYVVTPTGTPEKQVVTDIVHTEGTYTMPETFVQVDENLLQTIDDIVQCFDDGEMTVANDPLNKGPETMTHHQELVSHTANFTD